MRARGPTLAVALVAGGVLACSRRAPPAEQAGSAAEAGPPPDSEPPVALNGDSPIQYPTGPFEQRVEGDVLLRLFVDSTGRLAPESAKVAESSGYPALDSAALAGARKLRYAPARRHGFAVATAFLQPIEFRHAATGPAGLRGGPDTTRPAGAAPAARRDTTGGRRDTTQARPASGANPH